MHLFVVTLLATAAIARGSSHAYKKCCKQSETVAEVNDTYHCIENKLRRVDVLTNETNFLRTHRHGECVDVNTDAFIFNISNGVVISKRSILENSNYFPKCCPLGFSYNSIVHSCERSNETHEYITERFVKVGLPNCKVIVDFELRELNSIENRHEKNGAHCVDKNESGFLVLRVCEDDTGVCERMRCIKKCCPDGQSFVNRSHCVDTYTHGLNLSSFSVVDQPEDPFAIIVPNRTNKIYILHEKQYAFHLNNRGTLKYWSDSRNSYIYDDYRQTNSYCIEHTKTETFEKYLFFYSFRKFPEPEKFQYTLWAKILSCIFLVITVLVYLILNEKKTAFGKVMINYCTAIFFQTVLLIDAQTVKHPRRIECILKGFFLVFLTVSSFTWSNIICYDIWKTFGSTKGTVGEYYRRRALKKVLCYLSYGWGVPTIITLVVFFFSTYEVLPYSIHPLLGDLSCFFDKRNYAKVVFLNFPESIMQLVNIVLFIKTAVHCWKIKKEIHKMDDTAKDDRNKKYRKDRERLFLILKLSIIMGLYFTFEVVSAFLDMKSMGTVPKYIEIIWDTINCLQGVFIFIIFICKRKIFKELLKKFKNFLPRKPSSSSLYTQSTMASSITSKKTARVED